MKKKLIIALLMVGLVVTITACSGFSEKPSVNLGEEGNKGDTTNSQIKFPVDLAKLVKQVENGQALIFNFNIEDGLVNHEEINKDAKVKKIILTYPEFLDDSF